MGIRSVLSSCLSSVINELLSLCYSSHFPFSLFMVLTPCDLRAVSGVWEIFAERPCLGNAQEPELEAVGLFGLL